MHASFPRQAFVDALSEAAAVIPARSPKPILQSVRIEVGADESVVIATDLDVSVRRLVDKVDVRRAGVAVIPAAKLRSILSTSDDADFEIDAKSDSATVRFARSSFKLPLSDPDEYPVVETFGDRPFLAIESRNFDRLIRGTIFATDEKSSKYALYGVQLRMRGGRLWGCGADGRRIAVCRVDAEPHGGLDKAWEDSPPIVPAKGLRVLARAIEEDDPPVHVALLKNHHGLPVGILFQTERSVVYSRLAEGRFPDYTNVPGIADPFVIDFNAHTLRRAVDHASVFVSEISLAIDFNFGPNSLVLSGLSADVGESCVEVDCAGPDSVRKVSLYPQYVTDPLKALEKESDIRVEVGTPDDPLRILVGSDYEYTLAPITEKK